MESKEESNAKDEKPKTDMMLCEMCGSIYNKRNKARHLRSNKCKRVRYIWMERFEVTC